MKKRIFFLCLTILLFLSSCKEEGGIKPQTFHYAQATETDYEGTYYYSDSYFDESSFVYNPSLSTLSLSFAIASFASNRNGSDHNYSERYRNGKEFLLQNDFLDIDVNQSYKEKPGMDTMGAIFAHKQVGNKTLLAIGLRGGNYEREWASNFTLGDASITPQAEGFSLSAKLIIEDFKAYIEKYNITGNIKLWSSGYSRGAAVNNLLSGEIDREIEKENSFFSTNVRLKKEDFHSYCFETPLGASFLEEKSPRDSFYDNIHNIVNSNDLVPLVAFKGLGFTRYGIDHYSVDSFRNKEYEKNIRKVKKYFQSMDNHKNLGDYVIDKFLTQSQDKDEKELLVIDENKKNITSGLFLEDLISQIQKVGIPSLTAYKELYQEGLREMSYVIYQDGTPKIELFKVLSSLSASLLDQYDIDMLLNNLLYDIDAFTSDLLFILYNTLKGLGFTLEIEIFKTCLRNLLTLLSNTFQKHVDSFFTLLNTTNLQAILSAHYPELCLSHLMSQDTNFTKDILPYKDDGSYLILKIKDISSLSQVTIKDKEDKALFSFKEDKIDEDTSLSCKKEDDILTFYLSKEENYQTSIKDCSFSSLEEFTQKEEYPIPFSYSIMEKEHETILKF